MTKIKRFFLLLLCLTLIAFIGAGGSTIVFAETDISPEVTDGESLTQEPETEGEKNPVQEPETEGEENPIQEPETGNEDNPAQEPEISPTSPDNVAGGETDGTGETDGESNIEGVVAQFTEYLKEKYGADYETYYNSIIEQWGSIEGYLLSFGGKLPEEYKSGWDKFVGWLDRYSAVWAPALAVAIVIIVAVVGKKAFNNAIAKIVNAKIAPVVNELNAQSNATVSILRSQRALLGKVPKFSDNVKELEEAERRLADE